MAMAYLPRRKRPPKSLFSHRIFQFFVLSVFFTLLSFAVTFSSASPFLPLLGLRADPRAIQVARDAVRDVLGSNWDRLPLQFYSNDSQNMLLLVNDVRIPPVFASRLGPSGRRQLLRRLTVDSNGLLMYENIPRIVIVDLQNGLGNRLRALGSALEFAYYTRRILVILWATDAHINATMSDLFHPRLLRNLIIIPYPITWPINPFDIYRPTTPSDVHLSINASHLSTSSFAFFNFMAKDTSFDISPSTRIERIGGKHVYVKTAYILPSKWTRENLINAFIQKLTPAPAVSLLVHKMETSYGGRDAFRSMIGVHIRSRSILNDNQNVDHQCEYSIHGAAITDHWRKMSTPAQFIPEMHRIRNHWSDVVSASYALGPKRPSSLTNVIAQANSDLGRNPVQSVDLNQAPRFFVSADSIETLQLLYSDFSKHDIVHLPRNCDDRGTACIVYAFADIILLSRTGALLASGWSSFSEAAARLRVRPEGMDPSRNDGYVIRTSGVDFGGPSKWQRVKGWVWELVEQMHGINRRRQVSQEERRKLCEQRHGTATIVNSSVS